MYWLPLQYQIHGRPQWPCGWMSDLWIRGSLENHDSLSNHSGDFNGWSFLQNYKLTTRAPLCTVLVNVFTVLYVRDGIYFHWTWTYLLNLFSPFVVGPEQVLPCMWPLSLPCSQSHPKRTPAWNVLLNVNFSVPFILLVHCGTHLKPISRYFVILLRHTISF